jgi:hypothetical protein
VSSWCCRLLSQSVHAVIRVYHEYLNNGTSGTWVCRCLGLPPPETPRGPNPPSLPRVGGSGFSRHVLVKSRPTGPAVGAAGDLRAIASPQGTSASAVFEVQRPRMSPNYIINLMGLGPWMSPNRIPSFGEQIDPPVAERLYLVTSIPPVMVGAWIVLYRMAAAEQQLS